VLGRLPGFFHQTRISSPRRLIRMCSASLRLGSHEFADGRDVVGDDCRVWSKPAEIAPQATIQRMPRQEEDHDRPACKMPAGPGGVIDVSDGMLRDDL